MLSHPKIAIIGASGFIGANLLDYFVKKNIDAHGFARSQSPWRIDAFQLENKYSNIRNNLTQMINEFNPTVIINTATHGAYSFQQDENSITNSNLEVIKEVVKWSKGKKVQIIHLGTSSEYGINSNRPHESSLCEPNSKYANAKLATTLELQSANKLFGIKSTVLRLYSIYGPLEDSSRLMPTLVNKIMNSESITLTNPTVSRDFVYIQDLFELIDGLIEEKNNTKDFEIYNIASEKKTTMEDLARTLTQIFPSKIDITFSYPMRNWDLKEWVGNSGKIFHEYGWKSSITLTEGIIKLMEFYLVSDNKKYLGTDYSKQQND